MNKLDRYMLIVKPIWDIIYFFIKKSILVLAIISLCIMAFTYYEKYQKEHSNELEIRVKLR